MIFSHSSTWFHSKFYLQDLYSQAWTGLELEPADSETKQATVWKAGLF